MIMSLKVVIFCELVLPLLGHFVFLLMFLKNGKTMACQHVHYYFLPWSKKARFQKLPWAFERGRDSYNVEF